MKHCKFIYFASKSNVHTYQKHMFETITSLSIDKTLDSKLKCEQFHNYIITQFLILHVSIYFFIVCILTSNTVTITFSSIKTVDLTDNNVK